MAADESTSALRLVFTAKQTVACEPFTPRAMESADVTVKTVCSLMSTGTENIVFNELFAPGTHWANWAKFPFRPGYAAVGIVERVGEDVKHLAPGELVVSRQGHCSRFVAKASDCHVVPRGIEPQQAAWFALAKIASMGARKLDYELGDSVLVIGAGPIGQMSLRWAVAAGAEHALVLDPVASRLELARRGGATACIATAADAAKEAVLEATGGTLPRVVIDTTGHPQVFAQALRLVRDRGKVLLLGDTGFPEQQHLTADIVLRGLTLVGAHDGHETPDWNSARIYRLFFELVRSGRFNLSSLNTHTFRKEQCKEAYQLANERRGETMGVLFDWNN